ncbi:MAG: HAMP domain-containing sensor histidine kinase [Ignavibacteriales bacterium]|nr:HAMP domain-containing sensor histidine kinase [Ignavibacteriales bacterium]
MEDFYLIHCYLCIMKLKKKAIILITILISIALTGLILLQIYFLKNAIQQKEQAFDHNIQIVLNNVVQELEANEATKGIFEVAANDTTFWNGKLPQPDLDTIKYFRNNSRMKKPTQIFVSTYSSNENGKTKNIVIKIDSTGKRTTVIKDSVLQIKPDVRLPSGRKGFAYKYSLDSNVDFKIDDEKQVGIFLRELSTKNKKRIVTRVMDRLILTDEIPIEKRINLGTVDSLLKSKLNETGVSLAYKFGITSEKDNKLKIFPVGADKKLLTSNLKVKLFPTDVLTSPNMLTIYFPERTLFILKEISLLMILAFLFILIIVLSFIYTIRTIVNQKRFASLVVDFINNMTHEFKTPISTISLASEAIDNPVVSDDKEKLNRYNRIIKDENKRMRQQVEKILQMAVLEEGDYELDLTNLDFHSIIEQAAQNTGLKVDGNGGKLLLNLTAQNHFVKGDVVHLTNIIHNILDNAVKYSPDIIEINITTVDLNDGILIKISDKGIGIKEEDLKKIFDKYFRVLSGNIHDVKGFGLGLSYVKLMVEAHKGTITMNSKYNKGTEVQIFLPSFAKKDLQ